VSRSRQDGRTPSGLSAGRDVARDAGSADVLERLGGLLTAWRCGPRPSAASFRRPISSVNVRMSRSSSSAEIVGDWNSAITSSLPATLAITRVPFITVRPDSKVTSLSSTPNGFASTKRIDITPEPGCWTSERPLRDAGVARRRARRAPDGPDVGPGG
jgi:hypothetical protein